MQVWKFKENDNRITYQKNVEAGLSAAVCGEDMEGGRNTLKACLLKKNAEEGNDSKWQQRSPPKRRFPGGGADEVRKAVKEKGIAFRSWKKAKQGLDRKLEDRLKASYCQIKSETRKVIYRAQSENAKILRDMLEEGNEKGNVFKVVKRMMKDNKDVVGCGAVKDSNG